MKVRLRKLLLSKPLLYLIILLLVPLGCNEQLEMPLDEFVDQTVIELSADLPQVQAVMEIQDRYTESLMSDPDVVGTATGATVQGVPAVMVLVKTEEVIDKLPLELEDVPVVFLVTGEIRKLKGRPGGGGDGGGSFDPTNKHRPAPNGVSIGHPDITAGTLGCLVSNGGTTYILSNNHVMSNENQASNGDPIYQPGPFDGGTAADVIATLSQSVDIVFSTSANNLVDAAIAAVSTSDVTGATVSYGAPNTTTSAAAINMRVTKYGRTTESTNGRVQGINATVNVGYDTGVARFVNQIVIGGGGFSSGGDSGSLIVVQKGSQSNNPVGLLFAGGGGSTIANPIDDALSAFNVQIVGATGSAAN